MIIFFLSWKPDYKKLFQFKDKYILSKQRLKISSIVHSLL